ncbi:MAG: hypothetical protein KDC65_05345 [Saprospiraceae bacterium]|nr:hypothetical protein [Saprospiraceae bacterium]
MTDSKLIELFRSLTTRQRSRFGEFLESPYFNKSGDCIRLYRHIQKYAPDFTHAQLSKKAVLKKLDSEKPPDEKTLAYLAGKLMQLAETFLTIEAMLSDEWRRQMTLVRQYRELNLARHYRSARADMEKYLEKLPHRNIDFYREQLFAERLLYDHSDRNQRGFNEQLQTSADALDIYYIAEKLRYACEMLNYEAVLNIHYRIAYLEDVLNWSAGEAYAQVPPIQVYRCLVLMLRSPEEPALFEKARELIAKTEQHFSDAERKQFYTLLLNYCTRRINRFGDARFLKEHLEINKLLLQNGLMLEDGHIPPWDYTNIVAAGIKTEQAEWTRQFIETYRSKLPAQYADNTYRYNLAQYHYFMKNYGDAQHSLLQVETSDVLLNVTVRSLLIKIYCETEQDELLHSYLEATRIFLHRNQLLDPQLKRQMQKFVEFTAKFGKVMPGDRERFHELLAQLPPASEMMHREWLAAQIRSKVER